jgi:ribonuclease BN (tRNA processing enzyme)
MRRPSSADAAVILLGTGTPNAEPDRAGPSLAIVAGGRPHAVGYADLIYTPWTLERTEPLRVWGPPGLAAMTEHVCAAYEADVRERLSGMQPANDTGFAVEAREVEPGVVYEDDAVAVTAFGVDHGSWAAYGYEFRTAARRIVVSGDTAPSDILAHQARGADVLVHEVYSARAAATLPVAWRAYHAAMHTSTRQLAVLAAEARPKLLVLYHQLRWGASDEDLVAEVREGYDGAVVSARDLDVF